jgi:hypothetical protein
MNIPHQQLLIAGMVCTLAVWNARPASAQQPGKQPDPCALLTPAEVGGVMGVKVGTGSPIGTTGCQWDATPQSGSHARATLQLWGADAFNGMKTPLPHITKTRAGGIGQDAVYATVGSLTTLSVKQGKVAFVVRLYGIEGQDKQMAMEKALASDVVARL